MNVLVAAMLSLTAFQPSNRSVDFKLERPPVSVVRPSVADDGSAIASENGTPQAPPSPVRPQIRRAVGFGRDVPLSFAVRQIVPANVHVTFGPVVSTDAIVSWQGGRPWREVLRATVEPLGLHVAFSPGAIFISG